MRLLTLLAALTMPALLPAQEPALLPPMVEPPAANDPRLFGPLRIWSMGVELGLSGTEGNSENAKVRFGMQAKRETATSITKMESLYTFATQNALTSENRGWGTMRHEWLTKSPWSCFVSGKGEMDEFTAWDTRLSMHAGLAYNFIKTERSLFKGRLGAGGSQELGSPNEKFQWEGLAGFDAEHKFNERYKLVASGDYFPDFKDLAAFRVEGRASLEVLIDPDLNLTLKIGVLDRYDSTPEGRKPNDVEYFAVLLWKY